MSFVPACRLASSALCCFIAASLLCACAPLVSDEPLPKDGDHGGASAFAFPFTTRAGHGVTATPDDHRSRTAHRNWDLDCALGQHVGAVQSGVISTRVDGLPQGNAYGYGNRVCVRNPDSGVEVCHNHLMAGSIPARLTPGCWIRQGDRLGACGNSGYVIALAGGDGSHLDVYAVDRNGRNVELPSPATWPLRSTLTEATDCARPALEVLFPRGGERLVRGVESTVRWRSTAVRGGLQIDVYRGGVFFAQLAANDPDDGMIPFAPPTHWPTGEYQICLSAEVGTVWTCAPGTFSIVAASAPGPDASAPPVPPTPDAGVPPTPPAPPTLDAGTPPAPPAPPVLDASAPPMPPAPPAPDASAPPAPPMPPPPDASAPPTPPSPDASVPPLPPAPPAPDASVPPSPPAPPAPDASAPPAPPAPDASAPPAPPMPPVPDASAPPAPDASTPAMDAAPDAPGTPADACTVACPRTLRVALSTEAQRDCAGGWELVSWDNLGREMPRSPRGGALMLSIPSSWRGHLGVGAYCPATERWRDWSASLGRPAAAAEVASISLDGRELSDAEALVCDPPWAPREWQLAWRVQPMVPLEPALYGRCP